MYRAEEDYLKLIYKLTIEAANKMVKTKVLTNHLKHSSQSVIEMIKKLDAKKLAIYKPYQGVTLTNKGKNEALRIIRAHRIWEVFLSEKLGFNWDEIHNEAELLEHAGSEKIINKLYNYLNKPDYCKHGNPIPNSNGKTKNITYISLDKFTKPGTFIILRIIDDEEVLNFLNDNGFELGTHLKIKELDFQNNLLITNNNKIDINKKIASCIFGKWL